MAKNEGSGSVVVVMAFIMALSATGGSITLLATKLWETRKLEVKLRPRGLHEVSIGGDSDGNVKGSLELGPHEWSISPDGKVQKEMTGGFGPLAGGYGNGRQSLGLEIPFVFRGFEVVLGLKGEVEDRKGDLSPRPPTLVKVSPRESFLTYPGIGAYDREGGLFPRRPDRVNVLSRKSILVSPEFGAP